MMPFPPHHHGRDGYVRLCKTCFDMGINVVTSQGGGGGRPYHDTHINVCQKVILIKQNQILIKRELMI